MGVRPHYKGITIDPCIPRAWKEYKVRKHFRGSIYDIRVRNPKGVSKGIRAIWVDGKVFFGNVLPFFRDNRLHNIEVLMGRDLFVTEEDR